jgi:UDP-glucose 4-epimerase
VATALLTGGTGYIGSHTCVELIRAGHRAILFDNLCNSSPLVIDRIATITGTRPIFVEGDVRDRTAISRLLGTYDIDAVIHFAGLKAVGDSVARPLDYYSNNVAGSTALCEAMRAHGVTRIVFSSSATVYGLATDMPLKETANTNPTTPYGQSKLMVEQILLDMTSADPSWRALCLRYFNPVGAHESGMMGEDPRDTPNNLMPYVAQVAVGRLPSLRVFGNNYPTSDGTGVRDYIHVTDLATGHVAAIDALLRPDNRVPPIINLGTGRGHTVLEVVRAFEQAAGRTIPFEIVGRRPGDVAASYADPSRARLHLNWTSIRDLKTMCEDVWRWQSANPNGFGTQ